ncbi:MAG: conserved membrane protein of unknown function [Promethearchaeota archaeon]|nr:MAG: conserved membrane protein of unknown function [Candidatus Lokiarchaeota archaeon]
MKKEEFELLNLLGFIGGGMMLISEFLPWFSGRLLLQIFFITISVAIENSFLYLFPLISGIITLFGSGLLLYDKNLKLNSALIKIVSIGFLMVFFFDLISNQITFLPALGIGLYLCIGGFIFSIFDVINLLIVNNNK